jgi:hypothetical protein
MNSIILSQQDQIIALVCLNYGHDFIPLRCSVFEGNDETLDDAVQLLNREPDCARK